MMACRPWLDAKWGAPSTKLSALFSLLGLLWQLAPNMPACTAHSFSVSADGLYPGNQMCS